MLERCNLTSGISLALVEKSAAKLKRKTQKKPNKQKKTTHVKKVAGELLMYFSV